MSQTPVDWPLEDAERLAQQFPYTFFRPSALVLSQLRPGHLVKLIFKIESNHPEIPSGERMWVRIEAIDGTHFNGSLDNEPYYIDELPFGTAVSFEQRHIIQTELNDPLPSIAARYVNHCIVARRILQERLPVGYFYRDTPEQDDDSGWCFLVGDESQRELDDADNLALITLGALLSVDDSVLSYLEQPVGSAYERDPISGRFHAVDETSDD